MLLQSFLGRIVDADFLYHKWKKWLVVHLINILSAGTKYLQAYWRQAKIFLLVRVINNAGKGGFVPINHIVYLP
jgi:hypothetical protein